MKNETAKEAPGETRQPAPGLFEEILRSSVNRAGPSRSLPQSFVGECERTRHPTLMGRIYVSWKEEQGYKRAWLPTLHALSVRKCDRVLLQWPIYREPGTFDGP